MMFLILALTAFTALDLENAGALAEAGAAWEQSGNLPGQVRVAGRLLEEALYAGHTDRALLLISELAPFAGSNELTEFWRARAAWSCGLAVEAVAGLDAVADSTDDMWLRYRAMGLSELFSGRGSQAAEYLMLSMAYGTTARRKFWSALDLCSAYLNIGDSSSAVTLAALLMERYPCEALAPVMYGLCLHSAGRYSESFRILGAVDGSSTAAAQMAEELMKGFEQ